MLALQQLLLLATTAATIENNTRLMIACVQSQGNKGSVALAKYI